MKKSLSIILLFFCITKGSGQSTVLLLWEKGIPNWKPTDQQETQQQGDILWIEQVQNPTIAVYLPTKQHATGQGVVICPGGGYHGLAYDWEGTDIAKWLNSKGIAAFVLKYRLPLSESVIIPNEAPLQDAQRAIRLVRHNSKKWNVDKNKIGIMGFSAGGHLASTLGTHFDIENSFEGDGIDTISARPNFMALIYPVITMKEPYAHQGSREALLGENPGQDLIDLYSNELQIKDNSPATFLVHSSDDKAVPVENSLLFYKALQKAGISSEMHIYPTGGHGFSLGLKHGHIQSWSDLFVQWLHGAWENGPAR